jgi:predicted transcriptional regulator
MTLVGVIFGGLITGYFTYITQKSILDNQIEQFKTEYRIERNRQLRTELSTFVNDLSDVINIEKDKQERDKVLGRMMSSSMRIILLEDAQIGQQCFDITIELKEIFEGKKQINDGNFQEIISKWIVSIKSQMKLIDYSVDEKAIQSDILSVFLNSQLSEK